MGMSLFRIILFVYGQLLENVRFNGWINWRVGLLRLYWIEKFSGCFRYSFSNAKKRLFEIPTSLEDISGHFLANVPLKQSPNLIICKPFVYLGHILPLLVGGKEYSLSGVHF